MKPAQEKTPVDLPEFYTETCLTTCIAQEASMTLVTTQKNQIRPPLKLNTEHV